ncbi:DUF3489 domain-containing protein [Microbaculum marinisediminis]|uniref:DUF3489 domain-containing protein n=1 Tax=Microbaculum marinisediminis TaxID=2931392 RepID=A0AAW5QTR9_9HYPH|nr:DUF3489 domain-containing protein [Microbaculum sp. A6E488]MCT8971441.1 DUF3489 domain-containing protein [Microbaculum sp. A6E488]
MSTKTKPKPLSDMQLVILTNAAGRNDGSVLPVPASLKTKGAALSRVLGTLLKSGLISERRAKRDDEVWRTDDTTRLTLAITQAGLSAIGLEERETDDTSSDTAVLANGETSSVKKRMRSSKPAVSDHHRGKSKEPGKSSERDRSRREQDCSSSKSQRSTNAAQSERPANKTATITALLQSSDGATVSDLMEATGWQAHSVRGFLSGTLKKKLGYTVTSERQDGVRRYRIPA